MHQCGLSILLIIQLFNGMKLTAQDCNYHLYGHVVEGSNGLPISYAFVQLKELNKGTYTDSLGYYHIEGLCSGTYTLSCMRIGFEQVTQTVHITDNDVEQGIQMTFNPSIFRAVDVIEEVERDSPNFITSQLQFDKLVHTQANNLGKALSQLNGVTTLNTGSSISKPVVHGLHSQRVLVLNNGVRQEGQQWGNEHAPEIDPFTLHEAHILQGPSALQYGSDAIGGAILLTPKPLGQRKGWSGELNLIGASNGRQGTSSGVVEFSPEKINGLSARLQGTLKRAGNARTPSYHLANTGFIERNYAAHLQYKHKRFETEVYYTQFNTELGIFSGSHISNVTDLVRAIESREPAEHADFGYNIAYPKQDVQHELLKTIFSLNLTDKSKLQFTYARQFNDRKEFDHHSTSPHDNALPELQLKLTTHTGSVDWKQKSGKHLLHRAGISVTHQANTYNGRFFIPAFYQRGIGAYWIETWAKNKWSLEGGVRYDIKAMEAFLYENKSWQTFHHAFQNVSAGASALYKPNENWRLAMQMGTTWRPPQVSELYSNGLHHGVAAIENGNRHLQLEQSWNVASQAIYKREWLEIQLSPYLQRINDFIVLLPTGSPTLTIRGAFPTFEYQQVNALLSGTDLQATFHLTSAIKTTWKSAVIRAIQSETKEHIYGMPSDRHSAKVAYAFRDNGIFKQPSVSVNGSYVNKQWRVQNNYDYMPAPNAYWLLDIECSADIQIKQQAIKVSLGVYNALNTRYRDYMNRFRYYSDELGRNIAVHINIPFTQINKK
jgi:iron complex outermembrane receptor protein